jgi:hypothetical protein
MGRILRLIAALLVAPTLPYGADPAATFAAVVHQSNPTHNLRFRDLVLLFQGASREWPNGSNVVLVERDAGSTPSRFLMGRLLNTTPGDYKRSLQGIEYRGETPVSIKILNNVPSAIAIVETGSLGSPACGAVQVLRIDGKLPGEEGYRLK